jgi:uroporphyrinogen III methyltransferase/synthase
VDVVALYDTVPVPLGDEQREALSRASYVTFTSSSTVNFFMDAVDGLPDGARIVSIGPVTSATARELGLRVDVEPRQPTVAGLAESLAAFVAARQAAPQRSPAPKRAARPPASRTASRRSGSPPRKGRG